MGSSVPISHVLREWLGCISGKGDLLYVTGQLEPVFNLSEANKMFVVAPPGKASIISSNSTSYFELLAQFSFHFDWLATAAFAANENLILNDLSIPSSADHVEAFITPPVATFDQSYAELYVFDSGEVALLTRDRQLLEECRKLASDMALGPVNLTVEDMP